MWSIYGVFAKGKWGMTTNKKEAVRSARENMGCVRQMPYSRGTHYWDAPTFRVCSYLIADYREVPRG